MNDGVILR